MNIFLCDCRAQKHLICFGTVHACCWLDYVQHCDLSVVVVILINVLCVLAGKV